MFDTLTKRLSATLDRLRGRGRLTQEEVLAATREIRIALLEADVALSVVQDLTLRIQNDAVGQDITKGVTAGQQVVKIVHDALLEALSGGQEEAEPLAFGPAPCAYLMLGLQGSGKTTTTIKVARHLADKYGKRALAASLDTYRPAAKEQLAQLGIAASIDTLPIVEGENPLQIMTRALKSAKDGGYDVVLLDTAGRTSIDATMMAEAAAISKAAMPTESLLVVDAMTGQDAVNTAKAFADGVGVSGIILTRVDGDSRGGAALSMRAVTGKPIKLLGVGEKWDALEPFHAERLAGRILGMGDIVSLVEKAAETVDAQEAERMLASLQAGRMTFNDLLSQMRQMRKMGGLSSLMGMMPGLGGLAEKAQAAGLNDDMIKRQEAIVLSMTKVERARPEILNMSRKRRIAAGSGTTLIEVNKLIKQLEKMQTVMKQLRRGGLSGLLSKAGQLFGGGGLEMPEGMDSLLAQSAPPMAYAPATKKRKPRPKRLKRR